MPLRVAAFRRICETSSQADRKGKHLSQQEIVLTKRQVLVYLLISNGGEVTR
jgi:hypothetical protein